MDVLWGRGGELSAREVNDQLDEYALTTISTVLNRLSHKGIVQRRRVAGHVLFIAGESKAEHVAILMREALATTEHPTEAIMEFVRTAKPAERRALRRALT